ncbi:hypothetical protein GQ53DRAFT_816633 [Thozetella sp. PMI_491]|nr:hypothetical protein GQ53DRAFT_816633 [Thozetella sp. PMI_491]
MALQQGRRASGDLTPGSVLSDDEDNISLASTVEEQHDDDQEFEVECIICEDIAGEDEPGPNLYLVKWTGFPMHDCTWEPEENIGPDLMTIWEEDKRNMPEGQEQRNRQAFEDAYQEMLRQKEERRRKRDQLREKRGSAQAPSGFTELAEHIQDEPVSKDDSPPEEHPMIRGIVHPVPKQQASKETRKPTSESSGDAGKLRRIGADTATSQTKAFPAPNVTASSISSLERQETALSASSVGAPGTLRPTLSSGYLSKARVTSSTGYQGTARRQPVEKNTNRGQAKAPPANTHPRALKTGLTAKRSTRGGSNIFGAGKMRKMRTNLDEAMSDATKKPKLFKQARHMRLAEKKSRDKEDRAPPPSLAHLYDITKGPPGKRLSTDGASGQNVPAAAALDLSHQTGPARQGTGSSVASGNVALDFSTSDIAPRPSQAGNQVKRRKSVRFLDDDDEMASEPEDVAMDLDNPSPTTIVPPNHTGPLGNFQSQAGMPPTAPTKKHSLDSYRAKRQLTQRLRKKLRLGNAEPIDVIFDGLPRGTQQPWLAAFASQSVLEIDHTCSALSKGQIQMLIQVCLCSGAVMSEHQQAVLDVSAENLRTRLLALFYCRPEFSMIILPVKCVEWADFIDQESSSLGDTVLYYKIYSSTSEIGPMLRPRSPVAADDNSALDSANRDPSKIRDTVIQTFFSFSYTALLPASLKPTSHNFFLAFPQSQELTLATFYRWLRANNPSCRIFQAVHPGAWAAFKAAVNKEPGIVIVHELLIWTIHRFPGLDRKLCNGQDTFWCFSEPVQPLPVFPSVSTSGQCALPGRPELTRLFPHGAAFLLTPSFLVSEPVRAYDFLKWWLENWSKKNDYRLVAAYNFHRFLGELAYEKYQAREALLESAAKTGDSQSRAESLGLSNVDCEMRYIAATLATEIHCINHTKTTPYGKNEGFGSLTYADTSIDPSDEQSLVNWFGWWSTLRMDQYRKFCVVGSSPSIGTAVLKRSERRIRIPKYTLTTINDPDALMEVVQRRDLPPPSQSGQSSTGIVPVHSDQAFKSQRIQSDSFVSLKNVLGEIRAAAVGRHQWTLYAFPVSYANFDMMDHFRENAISGCKRISEWFDFSWSFVNPSYQGHKGFNTYIGFFYTIAEDWDKNTVPKIRPRSRHPWLAIYRPVNFHFKPYTKLELIIWDVSASHKFPHDKIPSEQELIDMQRRAIEHVRLYGADKNPHTTFERVWLGGFDPPPCSSPYPIDITLEFLDLLLKDISTVLPANDERMREKGFRLVAANAPQSLPAQLAATRVADLDQPMDLDSSDEEDALEDEDARIIFHPPRGRKLGPGQRSRCTNALFEAQEAARKRDPAATYMKYAYPPTEEWYKNNRAEGRSYEHVFVSSWSSLFDLFKIGQGGESSGGRRPSAAE